ncbi:sensor histidine kinase [Nonomuraea longicatena]|uniref:histidine kinase n=2 Tax=Nonomuraea longicatena TaxID=83682 RepID=A0ABN1RAG8_9ACTN
MDAVRVSPLFAFCLLSMRDFSVHQEGSPLLDVATSLVLLVPLLWRGTRPLQVFGFLSLVSFAQWALDYVVLPANLAVLVAFYSVVLHRGRVWAVAGRLVCELGVVLAFKLYDSPSPGMFVTSTTLVLTVGLTALYTKTRRNYMESLEERAERAERERDQQARIGAATERARIARELHDVVAHNVSVMVVQADGARYAIDGDPEQARLAVQNISRTGREALAEMRRLVGVLREDALDGDGAEQTDYLPQPGLGQLEELVGGAGVPAELCVSGEAGELPEGQQLVVYRIVQEALTNTLKHGGPGTRASVELAFGPAELMVRITDDGRGAAAPPVVGGHGLLGMRERVSMYGGVVSAAPRAGGGFEVLARLPVSTAKAA